MPFRTLGTRIALPAGFFALVSVAVLSFLLIRTQRQNALEEAILGSQSLAETIYLTISHEMRINRRDAIRETVEAVGRQEGIEGVRIYNKDGKISFSSRPEEVGPHGLPHGGGVRRLPLRAEPRERAPPARTRSREFQDAEGHTVLGTIRVIPNQSGARDRAATPPRRCRACSASWTSPCRSSPRSSAWPTRAGRRSSSR